MTAHSANDIILIGYNVGIVHQSFMKRTVHYYFVFHFVAIIYSGKQSF